MKNWDGTVSGVEDGENRSFKNLDSRVTQTSTMPTNTGTTPTGTDSATLAPAATTEVTTPPFARIDAVANLSPASEAGLKQGDLIVEFGPVNHLNHQNLKGLMPVITSVADAQQAISIKLLRQADQSTSTSESTSTVAVEVKLVPKPWPGRGLIGCHIIPYSDESS